MTNHRCSPSQSPSLRGSGRFLKYFLTSYRPFSDGLNPLHCGAAVASSERTARGILEGGVSIPFIAGQWSLPVIAAMGMVGALMSQSPSLRGSGRFEKRYITEVVAQDMVSIPFIAGQWSLLVAAAALAAAAMLVSIPFIAGQWSLPAGGDAARRGGGPVSIPFIAGQWSLRGAGAAGLAARRPCFNPLHCGAVVASGGKGGNKHEQYRVSIPFIAGQWSLRGRPTSARPRSTCLNPLHCGAVVASQLCSPLGQQFFLFQSPSLRGSGRFTLSVFALRHFIYPFQSPSLRGSGRFVGVLFFLFWWLALFQSPSLRGSGRF